MILQLFTLLISTNLFANEVAKTPIINSECKGDLTMNVIGLNNDDGQVKFDLDNSEETFKPKHGGPPGFMKGRSPIKDKKVEYIFKDIPCGDYAIKLYHDENMNQTMDFKFLKIPKEQYGFSNCKGCILPPSFEKAKFKFDKEHTSVTIDVD